MHVVLCHQRLSAASGPDELDVLDQVRAIQGALVELGHRASVVTCSLDLAQMLDELATLHPDVLFNLVESLEDRGDLIHLAPGVFSSASYAYTGAQAEALFLSSNKLLARQIMHAAGIPLANEPGEGAGDRFIVKSVWEHASRGMDAGSVVPLAQVHEEIARREAQFGGRFFAEEYIEGREFNVAVLDSPGGPQVLPVAEILFQGFAADVPKIVDYAAKWDLESKQYQATPRRFVEASEEPILVQHLQSLALQCWRAFDLRGYARVDFRVAPDRIGVLEVNANPCLAPDAGFHAALEQAGVPFSEAIARILQTANRPARTSASPTSKQP